MIECKDLAFTYKNSRRITFPDIQITTGEHCLLIGHSGSGKTTLLHLVGGLLRNYNGSLTVEGQELSLLSESMLDSFRGSKLGFIFQRNHLISALTVEKNLVLSSYLASIPLIQNRVEHLLERLGIADVRYAKVTELSQGQAQRVAIARAVINGPSLILADEPTSALDDDSCAQVVQLLMEVATENKSTLLISTHDQRLKDKISKKVFLNPTI